MATTSHWFLLFLFCSTFTSLFFTAEAFLGVVRIAEASKLSSSTQLHLLGENNIIDDHEGICMIKENNLILERRTFLETVSLAGLAATTDDAYAVDIETDRDVSCGNFNCLLDLPKITPGCTRLYLCRHGQTENNRLRMMQGARVDPPINSNGYEQAERLGIAVARLRDVDNINSPTIVAHSKLRRAKETASILTSYATSSSKVNQQMKLQVYGDAIPSLGEVDFGDLDGKDVNSAKSVMMSTFASWATGDIDKRAGGEGESGREGKKMIVSYFLLLNFCLLDSTFANTPFSLRTFGSSFGSSCERCKNIFNITRIIDCGFSLNLSSDPLVAS
jgi:broad specificity phosphatase PhoE